MHQAVLLSRLATAADRLWYAAKAAEQGWSRDVLALQIGSGLHLRCFVVADLKARAFTPESAEKMNLIESRRVYAKVSAWKP